jgi:hypothetical protein
VTTSLADRLAGALGAGREHTAVVVRAVYQPVGGVGRTVMPPTYPVAAGERDPNAKYLCGERLVDGEPRAVVVVDQQPVAGESCGGGAAGCPRRRAAAAAKPHQFRALPVADVPGDTLFDLLA